MAPSGEELDGPQASSWLSPRALPTLGGGAERCAHARPTGPPQPHHHQHGFAAAPEPTAPPPSDEASPAKSPARSKRDAASPIHGLGAVSQDLFAEQVSPLELDKWGEMMDMGIAEYMESYPERFRRRVRRGVPQRYRWQVWMAKVGVLRTDALLEKYTDICGLANASTKAIDTDVCRTLPELFTSEVSRQPLRRVLHAYAAHNPQVGYCQGMNFVAAFLLMVSNFREDECFAVLCRLMDSPEFGLTGFYRDSLPLLWRYLEVSDQLLASAAPDVREHFAKESVQPGFLTLFIQSLPMPTVLIIWDGIICEGLPVMLRIVVSMLQTLKVPLLNIKFEDIIKFFDQMQRLGDGTGSLNAARAGQHLLRQAERVSIPSRTMQYLANEEAENIREVEDLQTAPQDSQRFGSKIKSRPWIRPGGLRHRIIGWLTCGSFRRMSSASLADKAPSLTWSRPRCVRG